jgi:murein DD-endopeptidase MepM/ murein hydrolase activator NlpD
MKDRLLRRILLFVSIVLIDALMLENIDVELQKMQCFTYETAYENMRAHQLPTDAAQLLADSQLLTMYFATGETDIAQLKKWIPAAQKYHAKEFRQIQQYIETAWNDLVCFPVGTVAGMENATVSYCDSWMQGRTFGGERGHEGCDIMASVNERGIYPIYSVSDGVVENMGWLRLGGYRIGVRSPSGAYYYYAHLAEYASELSIGDEITAGTFLGYMGDTGYSDVPGTTGNFDVHLHFGIYLNDTMGNEFAINSYPMLYALEQGLL